MEGYRIPEGCHWHSYICICIRAKPPGELKILAMKRTTKVLLMILTAVLTIAFLTMVAVCITMKAEYWGTTMGNEAYGFFSVALMLTLIISIPTIILWIVLLKQRKRKIIIL